MNKKKSLYILGIIGVFILGYLNYFSDEGVGPGKEAVIETKNANYTSEDYKIDAENQKDFTEKKESVFQKAKASLKDTFLSGDSVLLDSARNLILKSNILGKTANGWSFSGEDLKYDKASDEFSSDTGISASNEEMGIKIKGDKFRSDSKMNRVSLTGNVVLENSKIDVLGDSAKYSNTDKKLELSGNVKLVGKNYPEKLLGEFGTLVYDGEKKLLLAQDKFNLTYGDILFSGNYFNYNQGEDTLLIEKDLVIKGKEYTITLDRVEKKSNSDILDLKGKIVGKGPEYSFSGDSGTYNLKTKELELLGNVEIKGQNGDEFFGDKILYNQETGILQGFGEQKEIAYKGQNGELKTSYLNYDSKNQVLTLDKGFQFKDGTYFGTGEKLVYNRGANDALLQNVEIYSRDRKLVTSEIDYNGTEGKVVLSEEFTISSKDGTEKFISKNGVYFTEKSLLETQESFNYKKGNTVATGIGIVYNTETGVGEIKKDIKIENSIEGTLVTGDRAVLENKEIAQFLGNIKFSAKGYTTSAEKAIYSFSKNSLEIPEKVKILSIENDSVIEMDNPWISLTDSTLTGKNFNGTGQGYKASSQIAIYNYKTSEITLKNSAILEREGNILKGNHLKYNTKGQVMEALGSYEIEYDNIKETGEDIYLNNLTGEIRGGKVKLITDKNETFQGNKIFGNLQSGVINISGNVKGRVYEKETPVDFSGNLVKIYLEKIASNYKVKKVEVRDNSTIKNKETTLYSKNIDIDLVKNIAEAFPNPKAILKDPKNGDTEVTSKTAQLNMNEDKIYLKENVVFKNSNPEKGLTTGKAGSGVVNIKAKTVELKEKPIIDSPEAIIRADKIIYKSITRKINATGEVVVDYKEKQ